MTDPSRKAMTAGREPCPIRGSVRQMTSVSRRLLTRPVIVAAVLACLAPCRTSAGAQAYPAVMADLPHAGALATVQATPSTPGTKDESAAGAFFAPLDLPDW